MIYLLLLCEICCWMFYKVRFVFTLFATWFCGDDYCRAVVLFAFSVWIVICWFGVLFVCWVLLRCLFWVAWNLCCLALLGWVRNWTLFDFVWLYGNDWCLCLWFCACVDMRQINCFVFCLGVKIWFDCAGLIWFVLCMLWIEVDWVCCLWLMWICFCDYVRWFVLSV